MPIDLRLHGCQLNCGKAGKVIIKLVDGSLRPLNTHLVPWNYMLKRNFVLIRQNHRYAAREETLIQMICPRRRAPWNEAEVRPPLALQIVRNKTTDITTRVTIQLHHFAPN